MTSQGDTRLSDHSEEVGLEIMDIEYWEQLENEVRSQELALMSKYFLDWFYWKVFLAKIWECIKVVS